MDANDIDLLDLWRAYPNSASIESDFFGLSQVLARHADQAIANPALRQELSAASVTETLALEPSTVSATAAGRTKSSTNP